MQALRLLLRVLPGQGVSRVFGWLARIPLPRSVQGKINRGFALCVGLDLSEAEFPPEHYTSLSQFFVRGLRQGARSWPDDPGRLASPADGLLGSTGRLTKGTALQAKGISYPVADLLGEPGASTFESGLFFTIYLGPRHYHRVHAPCSAVLLEVRVIPGRLLPVHPALAKRVPGLFAENERVVLLMETQDVRLAVVAVGATNVGSISLDFGAVGPWTEPIRTGAPRVAHPDVKLAAGDPLVSFHLGSTVIVLVEAGAHGQRLRVDPNLQEGGEIRVGTPLLIEPLGAKS